MSSISTSRTIGVVVTLVALAAGCQTLVGGPDPGTETGQPTGTEQNGTAETTVSSLQTVHERTLRQAGSATVRRSARYDGEREPGDVAWSDTTRIDFDSGRVLNTFSTTLSGEGIRYRNGSGVGFTSHPNGEVSGPDTYQVVDVNRTIGLVPTDGSRLEHRGQGTVDGVTGTVYRLAALDWADNGNPNLFDPENVVASNATYVVNDRGYVAYQRLTVTAQRESGTVTYVETKRVTDVGSTTVERPAWVGEADTDDRDRPVEG